MARRRNRRRREPKAAQTPTTYLITTPFPGTDLASCSCPICDVLRDELGHVPETVDMSKLSRDALTRLWLLLA